MSAWIRNLSFRLLGLMLLIGFVILVIGNTLSSCILEEASSPDESPAATEYVTQETVEALVQVIVELHDRVAALEDQQVAYLDDSASKNVPDGPDFDNPDAYNPVLAASVRRLNQKKAWENRDLDCSHFDSWERAQGFYEMKFELVEEAWLKGDRQFEINDAGDPWDVYNLDSDRDGVACEALR